MSAHIRRHVVAYVALFVALGGTAAALPGKNTVDSGDIKRGQVKTGDLAKAAVTNPKLAADAVDGSKVADDTITGDDVDEASLEIPEREFPQPEIPATLPPSGAAGGDLSGSYPNPQVQESQLSPGGDLAGTLAEAQVSEGGLDAGGDLAGSTVANAQLAPAVVGDAEIADGLSRITIPASEIGPASINGPGQPDAGSLSGHPAALFDPNSAEALDLLVPVPPEAVGDEMEIKFLYSAAATGNVRWRVERHGTSPGTAEVLTSPTFLGSFESTVQVTANRVRSTFFGLFDASFEPNDIIRVRFTRLGADGGDTLVTDAALLAVTVDFKSKR